MLVDDLHEALIEFGVVHSVSGEQFNFFSAFMGLQSLPVKFGLHVVHLTLVLFEVTHLLLAGQHRPDGEEDLHLIVQTNVRVLEFAAGLRQTVGQVEEISGVGVEGVEQGCLLETYL
jgi:hypothetical protein